MDYVGKKADKSETLKRKIHSTIEVQKLYKKLRITE